MDRLHIWLASLAIVIGLGSVTTGVVLHTIDQHAVCHSSNVQGAHTRKFVSDLVSDPTVSEAQRSAIVKLALEDFPRAHC